MAISVFNQEAFGEENQNTFPIFFFFFLFNCIHLPSLKNLKKTHLFPKQRKKKNFKNSLIIILKTTD